MAKSGDQQVARGLVIHPLGYYSHLGFDFHLARTHAHAHAHGGGGSGPPTYAPWQRLESYLRNTDHGHSDLATTWSGQPWMIMSAVILLGKVSYDYSFSGVDTVEDSTVRYGTGLGLQAVPFPTG